MFKIQFITKKLELTKTEAESFWPVYDAHKKAMQEIIKTKMNDEIDDNTIFFQRLLKKKERNLCGNKLMIQNDNPIIIIKKCCENNETCLCLDGTLVNKENLLYDAIEKKMLNHIEILYILPITLKFPFLFKLEFLNKFLYKFFTYI